MASVTVVVLSVVTVFPFASCTATLTAGAIETPAFTDVGWTKKPSFVAVPGFTTTDAVGVMSTPAIVAETVFVSATVEVSVPVICPLEFVVPTG